MKKSRTRNVVLNAFVSALCQFLAILMNFISRTVFIKLLGIEYLGVNGLFTNILTILSFAELGVGNAIIFSLYKPLAVHDEEKIKSLMKLYQRAYRIIGIVVLVAGSLFVPFLSKIIAEKPDIVESLVFIYLLYLANSAVSYFYSYKKSLIIADQKSYIVVVYSQLFLFLRVLIQSVILWINRDFICFLVIQIIFTLLENIVLSRKADKMYPILKEKATPLKKEETKGIFSNVKALIMYKFGSIILNGTDNIIISSMLGVIKVGLVSNYLMIINAVNTLVYKVLEAFTSSIGNLNATAEDSVKYKVFLKTFLINSWIYGYLFVLLMLVFKDTINVWLGESFLLNYATVFALMLHMYVNGVHNAVYTYRTTLGYFVQGRYSPAIAAVLNVILSVVLCKLIGLSGIFFATSISRFFVVQLVDVYLVYKKTFKVSPLRYYIRYFAMFMIHAILYYLCMNVISFISLTGIFGLIIKCFVITVVFNGLMLIIFFKNEEFRDIYKTFTNIGRKFINGIFRK